MSNQKEEKLLDQVRNYMRLKHYSIHTERSYCDWIVRFVKFHDMTSRDDFANGEKKVEKFLTWLAVERSVSPSTQNQAMNALIFLYKAILKTPLTGEINSVRARRKINVPTVMTREEVRAVIANMHGRSQLLAKLLYGCGLRIMEAVRLRVKDVDLKMKHVVVRSGKGDKDRVSTFPEAVIPLYENHLDQVKKWHDQDKLKGYGEVYLPNALERKYPDAAHEWKWQYVFPSGRLSKDPRSKKIRRHHIDPSAINRAIKTAAKNAGLTKQVSAHTFRHSFATHLLERGTDIRTIQALLGHKEVSTTMIYTHILNQGGHGVKSPLDDL